MIHVVSFIAKDGRNKPGDYEPDSVLGPLLFVVYPNDPDMNEGGMFFVKEELSNSLQNPLDHFVNTTGMSNSFYERIKLEKLPCVHRAVSATVDLNGRNFAILQSDPKTSFNEDFGKLLREATETESIHDVTCQVGNQIFHSHKYILAMRSDYFRKVFFPDEEHVDMPDVRRPEAGGIGYECATAKTSICYPPLIAATLYMVSYLCDVTLRSEDGKEFDCHKCVLCARL
eukprot:g46471.t1